METSNIRTLYEVSWHYDNGTFSHCSIEPITITAMDGEVITARDAGGYAFRGTRGDYYESEDEAKASIVNELQDATEESAQIIRREEATIAAIQRYLEGLK